MALTVNATAKIFYFIFTGILLFMQIVLVVSYGTSPSAGDIFPYFVPLALFVFLNGMLQLFTRLSIKRARNELEQLFSKKK